MHGSAPFPGFLPQLLTASILVLGVAHPSQALTRITLVTPGYLREHVSELSLKVSRRPDGMLAFSIDPTTPKHRQFTARLLVKQDGMTLAETSLLSYGQKLTNTFTVSTDALPVSEFHLVDHVPEDLRK